MLTETQFRAALAMAQAYYDHEKADANGKPNSSRLFVYERHEDESVTAFYVTVTSADMPAPEAA